MNIKQKSKNKYTANKFRYFLESGRLFVLVYSNQDDNVKMYKARRYYLPKSVIKNYNVIANG